MFDYCRRSANPIGRLVLRIAGYRDERLERSSDALCTALQLTNFWQDFGRDWRAGRLYVPRDVVVACRAREMELEGPRLTESWMAALADVRRHEREPVSRRAASVCDGVSGRLALRTASHVARRQSDARSRRADRRRAAHSPAGARRARCAVDLLAGGALAVATVMARKTSFYYSFLVLPAEQRRAIVAVWDFCRAVDDAVDEEPAASAGLPSGRDAVAFWREELARAFDGGAPRTSQGRRLQPFIAAFGLPRQAFEDVIDGVAMDLDTTRYATFDDLFEYCRRVASAVGLICIRIFGCTSARACEYALNLGVALQLTNILRDVGGDLAKGRVYLPLEDLRRVRLHRGRPGRGTRSPVRSAS